MSAAHVIAELKRFLNSTDPEVICVSGRWGVGKTFVWNRLLSEARSGNAIGLETYAYVSLFGKKSLDDLKQSIFESSESTKAKSGHALDDGAALINGLWRRIGPHLTSLPKIGDVAKFASQFYFLAVRQQIVCIDDLERAGKGLDAKDVLGMASFLKEQRGCKVVLLLNHEELSRADRAVYNAQLEKVADTVMAFEPTAAEAAAIGVDDTTSFAADLRLLVSALGITNIRVIKRIERLVRRLETFLAGYDREVFDQALHTAAIFGWAEWLPSDAPPVEYLRRYNQLADYMSRKREGPDPSSAWRSILTAINYTATDEFDLVISTCVAKGYVEEPALALAAERLQSQKRAAKRENSFQSAWDLYHGSFQSNDAAVLDALAASFERSVDQITPINASSTIALFRELGREQEADKLVQEFIAKRTGGRDAFDLESYAFSDSVRDPGLIAAMRAKAATFQDAREPRDVLLKMATDSGWDNDDLAKLSSLSASKFYQVFKSAEGDDLKRIVRAALQFRSISNATDEMKRISTATVAALQRIAKESPLNRRRVAGYGVDVPPTPKRRSNAATKVKATARPKAAAKPGA